MKVKALLILFILVEITSCSAALNNISQRDLQIKMISEKTLVLLDVRSIKEYQIGHISGAINIPHHLIENRISELGQTKNINVIVYCRSGARAQVAQAVLIENGFTNTEHLIGDFPMWQKNELSIENNL